MSKFDELKQTIDVMTTAIYSKDDRELLKTALTQAAEIERGNKVVVPRDLTEEAMDLLFEVISCDEEGRCPNFDKWAKEIYKTMIAASEGK